MKKYPKPSEIPQLPKTPEVELGEAPKPILQPGENPEIAPAEEPIEEPSPQEVPPGKKNNKEQVYTSCQWFLIDCPITVNITSCNSFGSNGLHR